MAKFTQCAAALERASSTARSICCGVIVILACTLVLPGRATRAQQEVRWVEETFEDFNDGEFDASGQNLYATRRGTIEAINRFDLNGDGFLDLVFNSSHDFVTAPKPTCYELSTDGQSGKSCELPAHGTSLAAVSDLNKDGFSDLVLCPNNDWVTSRRYLFIFWGDSNGWSARRMTNLLTIAPKAVQVADLNGDGWPEILVLNGTRWAPEDGPESVLRIYWGSHEAYRQEQFSDVVLANAQDLKAQDLDGDRRDDLAVLQSEPGELLIFWNDGIKPDSEFPKPSKIKLDTSSAHRLVLAESNGDGRPDLFVSGGVRKAIGKDPTTGEERFSYSGVQRVLSGTRPRDWSTPQLVSTPPSSALAVADLDKDGWADIVLANSGAASESVRILWGDREGLYKGAPSKLQIAYGSALAIGDLNADNNLDLVVGVAQTKDSYDANSRVFYGDGRGGFDLSPLEIPTASVTDVAVAPGRDAMTHRLVFCNRISGRINEDIPVITYWGAKDGFNPERLSRYHNRSGYASTAADLNSDGLADLVLLSIKHNVDETHPEMGFNILWGGKDGPQDGHRTVVPEYGLFSVNVADVDRDGYLDLVGTCNARSPEGEPLRVVIWHGGPKGFEKRRRVVLPCPGAEGQNVIADFNKDGYLDIAVGAEYANQVVVFWGGKEGFSETRKSSWPLVSANDVKTADLDRDGWLDLIVATHKVPGTLDFDFGTYVYWGSSQGFSPINAQRLPGHSAVGLSVADYDGDGYLDLYLPNYHYGNTRESVASYLYWGGPNGFSELNRTDLTVDSGHGSMAGDFNGDGLLDLAVACHSRNGTHLTRSKVFYNDGQRFKQAKWTELPTVGTHYMQRADVGHLYDRSYRQSYLSSVFSWTGSLTRAALECTASLPGKSRLEIAVRQAHSKPELQKQPWIELGAAAKHQVTIDPDARCIQYRAVFVSDNGDRYPLLDRMEITLSK